MYRLSVAIVLRCREERSHLFEISFDKVTTARVARRCACVVPVVARTMFAWSGWWLIAIMAVRLGFLWLLTLVFPVSLATTVVTSAVEPL